MFWTAYTPDAYEYLGFIPGFLSLADPAPAKVQFHKNYRHGGGWLPFGAGQWHLDPRSLELRFPGDPPLEPVAAVDLRDETVVVYPHAIVMILQNDGTFEVARLD
jgi:hypothetical protein